MVASMCVGDGACSGSAWAFHLRTRCVANVVALAFDDDGRKCVGASLEVPERETNARMSNASGSLGRQFVDMAHNIAVCINRRTGFFVDRLSTAFTGNGTWHG